ncbi:MAG: GNAT family N-acetyltransferase [Pseudomonadota bacterium]
MTTSSTRAYPLTLDLEDGSVVVETMGPDDRDAVWAFAKSLPAHDLIFVRRDISKEKVMDAWVRANGSGSVWTVLARQDGAIVGCVALIRDRLSWSPHVGEVRALVSPAARKKGLGRLLIEECFRKALSDGVEKLVAHMTPDQKGAIGIFEELGFRAEALLKDHVKDREGGLHDIVILSCDVERVANQLSAYGVSDA